MAKNKLEKPQLTSSSVITLPKPPLRNAEEYLKAYTGYAYTAISAIAQEVASMDLSLYKVKYVKGKAESSQVLEHEALSVLSYVNPLITFYDLIEATQIYLELTGECFWIVLREGDKPKELWPVRPDWMKIVPSKTDVIDHYTYHPGGGVEKVVIPKENVIHFKYFHPLNPYRGKGSIQAAALPLDIHTFAQEYNRNFFFNSAIPSLVFSTDKKLSATVIKKFMNQWQASYGGRGKSNKIAFMGNGLKMDKVNANANELDFAEQLRMMRDDVLAVFKVPKSILGLTEDVNRANAEATNLAFMERVITPRMRKIVETLNEFLIPMYGDSTLFLDFTDPAPENVEMKLKYYENGLKFGWLTPNEVRAEENREPVEGGDELPKMGGTMPEVPDEDNDKDKDEDNDKDKDKDEEKKGILGLFSKKTTKTVKKIWVPRKLEPKPIKHMIKIPVKKIEAIEREKLKSELAPKISKMIGELLTNQGINNLGVKKAVKNDKAIWSEKRKDIHWRAFIEKAEIGENALRLLSIDLFRDQEKLVLTSLHHNVKNWVASRRKGLESSVLPSLAEMNKLWLQAWKEATKVLYIRTGLDTLDELGVAGDIDLTTDTATAYLNDYSATMVKGVNKTTRDSLRKTLAEGFKEGEGIDKLTKRVKGVFKVATTSRATMIARTESLRAANAATVEAYRQSHVVEAKEWLAERDDRTCPFCEEMDGKTIGLSDSYHNLGDSMDVGDNHIDFDYVDVDEPPLHSNCRCTVIPVLKS